MFRYFEIDEASDVQFNKIPCSSIEYASHRDGDLPSYISAIDGDCELHNVIIYEKHGMCHRLDKPALIEEDYEDEYFIYDRLIKK